MSASTSAHLVMSVDHGFTLPLAVALSSVNAARGGLPLTVHVLHPGLSESVQNRICAPLVGLDVSWILVDRSELNGAHYSDFLSDASLFRLLLGDLLPEGLERVLYIDADTLVTGNVGDLFAIDLEGQVLGAVRDAISPWAAGAWGADWRNLGLDPSSPYFNSGVLLIDLVRWRDDKVGAHSLDLLRQAKPQWGDQDALNVVLESHWMELPREWNVQTGDYTGQSPAWALWRSEVEAAVANPSIVHFTGRDKPWDWGTEHPAADQWFAWLDKTAWAGWRPTEPQVGRVESQLRKAMRGYRRLRSRSDQQFPA